MLEVLSLLEQGSVLSSAEKTNIVAERIIPGILLQLFLLIKMLWNGGRIKTTVQKIKLSPVSVSNIDSRISDPSDALHDNMAYMVIKFMNLFLAFCFLLLAIMIWENTLPLGRWDEEASNDSFTWICFFYFLYLLPRRCYS